MSSFTRLTIFVFVALASVSRGAPMMPAIPTPNTGAVAGLPLPLPRALPLLADAKLPIIGDVHATGDLVKTPRALPILADSKLPIVGDLHATGDLVKTPRGLPLLTDAKVPIVGDLHATGDLLKAPRGLPLLADTKLPIVGDLHATGDLLKTPRRLPLLADTKVPVVGDLHATGDLLKAPRSLPLLADAKVPIVGDLHATGDLVKTPLLARSCGPCEAQSIVNDAMGQLTPVLQQITSVTSGGKLDINALKPLVGHLGAIFGQATDKISTLAQGSGSGPVSVDDVTNAVGPLANSPMISHFQSVLTSFGGLINLCGNDKTDLSAVTAMLSNPTANLGDLLHSVTNAFGGDFTSSIIPQITNNFGAVQQIGGQALQSFDFLNANGLLGKVNGIVSGLSL
ncbi:hypothetical protein V5O48_002040 [Marasmius crinis-equi]|uniref:Uncharacterized protein n=1 Tax=Marasmius crinis-equi TaxID=585013 RepID=A0ABR3FXA3_9AGAR